LTIFGALSFAVALLCDRPLWQRIVIVLSSIPIALIVNVVRIMLTGVMFAMLPGDHEDLRHLGHTMWGLVMMPMALGLLFIEYKVLVNLVIEDDDDVPPLPAASQHSASSKTKPEEAPSAAASGRLEADGSSISSVATGPRAAAKTGNGALGQSQLPTASGSRPPRHRTPN
jgi:exosortase/archaeosortase family protein